MSVASEAPLGAEPSREVRFGLVLYGGVSLAVYIYGVAYEFQRLVRASKGVEENAWSAVLRAADATATVDIVSGASAGGINGLLLGKALSSGADLRAVRSLWVDEADLGRLLHKTGEEDPKSLLRSSRFRELLEGGLAQMDSQSLKEPLVSAFDLFVAGTRVRPWVREFETDLGTLIQSSDYRKSFNLKFRHVGYNPMAPDSGYDHDDFGPGQNPVLTDVAQATSAFPVAFEPVEITVDEKNKHLFADDEPASGYFSDGGILHNKPFTETISTILTRSSGRPVDRWLVSVEPDPEHAVPPTKGEAAPDVVEVASKAVMGIPRYQSIAADLERLQLHRERARKAREKLRGIDEALLMRLASQNVDGFSDEDLAVWREIVLEASDYMGERRRHLATLLAERITAAWPEPHRSLAKTQLEEAAAALGGDLPAYADPGFERRRVYHLLELARDLLEQQEVGGEEHAEVKAAQLKLWAQFDRIDETMWNLFDSEAGGRSPSELDSDGGVGLLQEVAAQLVGPLQSVRQDTRAACESLEAVWVQGAEVPMIPRFVPVFDWFELWDAQLLTISELSDASARDEIRLARISPADAQFVKKPAKMKLAGDALGHFGGFLKKDWRRNDLLWGRLDAAEMICRMLMQGTGDGPDGLELCIRLAQEQVIEEELPKLNSDYLNYMEKYYNVGEETLADVQMEDRASLGLQTAEVVRNMFRGLQSSSAHKALQGLFGVLAKAVGIALFFLRWPIRALWDRDPAVRRAIDLAILFIGLWSIASVLLVILGVIGTTHTLWILIGSGLLVFLIWSLLQARFHKVR